MPLEPVTRKNGGLQFIKGSHTQTLDELKSKVSNPISRDQDLGMHVLPDFDDYPDAFEFLEFDLEPGDCLVFHINIVHMGHHNPSTKRRRALSTRWFGDGCTDQTDKPHILAIPNIVKHLERHGYIWDETLDHPLFPSF